MNKSDLNILRDINRRMRGIKAAEVRLRETVTNISAQISDMPRSGQQRDRMAEYAAKYSELEDEYIKLDQELMEKYLNVEREVSSLPLRQAEVINSKYRDGKTWKQICREQHISKSQAHRDHENALISLGAREKKLNKNATIR